jgi:pyridoxal phosphate enzyme (YggS family)
MIGDNLAMIRQRISEAARRSGHAPETVRLLAVSKKVGPDLVREAVNAGQELFGENYVQEAHDKIRALGPGLTWHFIGHLQTNKARLAAELFDVVETIDRPKLAFALDAHLTALGRTMRAFVQVNVGEENQKSGVLPDKLESLLKEIKSCRALQVTGLMAIPPYEENPEASRPYFAMLRKIGLQLVEKGLLGRNAPLELSMGMSGDFEVAIEEGATVVRVGTALFGERSTI